MNRLCLVPLLALLACTSATSIGPTPFDVTLENQHPSSPIHILGPGEDFDPSNRLDPGETRSITLTATIDGEGFIFRAGSNGTVADESTCRYRSFDGPDVLRETQWRESGGSYVVICSW